MMDMPLHNKLQLSRFVDTKRPVTSLASHSLVLLEENRSIRDAIEIMMKRGFRKIPLVNRKGELRGILTETDILNFLGGGEKSRIFRKHNRSLKIPVSNIAEKRVVAMDKKTDIRTALGIFKKRGKGLYPVLDGEKIRSVVSEWDIIKTMKSNIGVKVMDVMVKRPMVTGCDFTAYEVSKVLCKGGFRRLPVTKKGVLVGIITPHDVIRYLRKNKKESGLRKDKTTVDKMMERDIVSIGPDAYLSEAIRLMKTRGIGGFPVMENEELMGIITERDVIDALQE